jgi:hypothetical protein
MAAYLGLNFIRTLLALGCISCGLGASSIRRSEIASSSIRSRVREEGDLHLLALPARQVRLGSRRYLTGHQRKLRQRLKMAHLSQALVQAEILEPLALHSGITA